MEGMHSMSHLMFNQVEQIADVKTCNIDNTEQRYYKVQWKCTWEPAIVLERFCSKIIADYEKGPSSCENKIKTVEEKKQHNLVGGNCRTDLTENSVDMIQTEQFEDTCNLFSLSNIFEETPLQRDDIEKQVDQSQMSSHRFNKESNETCSTNEVQNGLNESLPTTNNAVNNKLNLHNLDIKTEPDNEVFPNINIQKESYNTSFNHAITTEKSSFNHADIAEESSFTDKEQNYGFLLSLDSADLITEGVVLNTNTESSNIRRNQLENHCFKCQLCSYSSPKKSILKRHMRKHTGEKPFKCSLCSYSASQKNNLQIHMSKHTGNYPYKCKLCPFSTAHYSSINFHIMTHTGEKPFKCDQCDYATITKTNLKRHIKMRHQQVIEM